MYNRYIRNDDGDYTCHPQPEPPGTDGPCHEPPPKGGQIPFLSSLLEKFHLSDIDTGDLLLLLLLFYLFKEGGDEELLIAIGLLLIL